jgi:glycosyltransferase involved in cell wall biosynthesis
MVSIVIPIYNEEEIFHILHERVTKAIAPTGEEYEIVYVNDGSRDRSLPIMLDMQARDPHVVVIDLSRNWGHMGAVYAGLTTAKGDAVVLMDGDLQDPPEVIPQFIAKWRQGAQVVTAVRRSRQESRKGLGMLFALWHKLFDKISDFKIPANSGVFGLCDRQAMDAINALTERNRYFPGLRAWVGFRNEVVYYDRADRAGGEGKLSFMSRIKYATDAIYTFSYKPLRLAMLMGVLTMVVAIVLGIAAIADLGGYAAYLGLFAAVAFIGSLQMISLGVFAEYIARIYDEIRARPISLINRVYRADRATGLQFHEIPPREEQLRAA